MTSNSQAASVDYDGSLSAVRGGLIQIDMQNRQLDDSGAEKWCAWARETVPEFIRRHGISRRPDAFLTAREVNFSNNFLGDLGMTTILRVLHELRIGVKVLKLFKNCLGRAAASALMDWLVVTPISVFELHLSHNFIPREGAVDILKAVAYNTSCYPIDRESPNRGRVPLWLRLEQNIVMNPDELLQVAEGQMKKLREVMGGASTTTGPMLCDCRAPGCCSNFCTLSRPDGHCPLAQVTYLAHQRDSRIKVPAEAQAWHTGREQREEAARWRMCATAAAVSPSSSSPPANGVRGVAAATGVATGKSASGGGGGGGGGEGGCGGGREGDSGASGGFGGGGGDASEDTDSVAPAASPHAGSRKLPSARGTSHGPPPCVPPPCAIPPPSSPPVLDMEATGISKPAAATHAKPGKVPPPSMPPLQALDSSDPASRFLIQGEVKAPPPGLFMVKPPPPGFEPAGSVVQPPPTAGPLAATLQEPLRQTMPTREFKAPPLGFQELPSPIKAPPSTLGSAPSPLGSASVLDGVLSRAMREAPMAPIKSPPPSKAQTHGAFQEARVQSVVGYKDPPSKQPASVKEPPVLAKGPPVLHKSPPVLEMLTKGPQVLQASHDARVPPVDGPPMPTGLKVIGSSGVRPLSIEQRPPQDLTPLGLRVEGTDMVERGDELNLAASLAFAALDQPVVPEDEEFEPSAILHRQPLQPAGVLHRQPGQRMPEGGLTPAADAADGSFFVSHLSCAEPLLDLEVDHPPEVLKLEIRSLRRKSDEMGSEVRQLRENSKDLQLKLSEAEARIFALEGQLRCLQGSPAK